VKVNNRSWTCDELDRYHGDKVIVHVPKYGYGFNQLLLHDANGDYLGVATPDEIFQYHDQRGAERSARRKANRNASLRQMDKSVPTIDVGAEIKAIGARAPEPATNIPRGKVSVQSVRKTARTITPEFRPEQTAEEYEAERRRVAECQAILAGKRAM
jgi:hypothetical protein